MKRCVAIAAMVGMLVVGGAGSASAATKSSTSDAASVEALQRQLNALGCNAGTIDGALGPNTIQAVRWFQTAAGITVDGIVGQVTSAKLAQAAATGSPTCRSVPAPTPVPTATTVPANAAAACTQANIQAGAQASLLVNEKMTKSGPFQCANGFAFNAPTIAASGAKAAPVVLLLQWNGSQWRPVNRALYCESGSVPKLIYARTCLTSGTPAKSNAGTSDAASVQNMQRELNALGCNAGTADGKLGPKTVAAIRWFQAAAKVPVDGIVGPLTSSALTQASTAGSPSCTQVSAPAAPTPSKGGPQCTQAPIQAAAQASLQPGERLVASGPFQCAGIWAYNGPTIASSGGPDQPVNLLMRWNGTAWQVVDRAAYCESGDVPAAVAQKACQV